MKAITTVPGTGQVFLAERDEPQVTAPDHVKLRVLQVGICGTDREEAAGGRATAPAGKEDLVMGHEMLGQVVETGENVTSVKPGDFGVFMVRRGCGECAACLNNRSDMCFTGAYTERGIKGADGYQSTFIVDAEQYLVKVPAAVAAIGILTEPMSVAAKAIDESMHIQASRLRDIDDPGSWMKGKRALVAGIGPIGLLAAVALRLRGADVTGLDVVPEDSIRAEVLRLLGGRYLHGDIVGPDNIRAVIGPIDFVFEATGIATIQFELMDLMAVNAIYVATGIPAAGRPVTIPGSALMQQLVLNNQVVLGSVNASIYHYRQAVEYLAAAYEKWPEAMSKIITHRYAPADFDKALHLHGAGEIKVVIEWAKPE